MPSSCTRRTQSRRGTVIHDDDASFPLSSSSNLQIRARSDFFCSTGTKCVHQKIRKIQKKSPNAHPGLVPVERSTGTFFFYQNPIFLQFGSAVLLLSFQLNNRTAIANEKYRVFCYRVFCSSGMFQWNKKSEQALRIGKQLLFETTIYMD